VKRRAVKKQIHELEVQLAIPAKKYLQAGRKVHRDYLKRYENEMEVCIFRIIDLYLRLDPSWPHNKRWLDYFEDFTWKKNTHFLRGRATLWWFHASNTGEGHVAEYLEVYIGTIKRGKLLYAFTLGREGNTKCFSNRGRSISYKRKYC